MNDMTISSRRVMARHAWEAVASGEQILKIKLGYDIDEDRRRLAGDNEAAPECTAEAGCEPGLTPAGDRDHHRLRAGRPADRPGRAARRRLEYRGPRPRLPRCSC